MQVVIYKARTSATQSGPGTGRWIMETKTNPSAKYIDGMMGWTGSRDMNEEIKIYFDSQEQAVDFAKENGYDYEVINQKKRKVTPNRYADNFK
jgi:uncharacterized protein YcnI